MISTGHILTAALVTGIAVGLSAALLRWALRAVAVATLSSFVLVVVWRTISNFAGLNGDYVPGVGVGDTACLVAGALGPAVVASAPSHAQAARWRRWLTALVGGVVGFLVNVVVL